MMFSKTKVAITQRVDFIAGREELRDALDQRLVNLVLAAGYLPVAVPNTLLKNDSNHEMWINEWLDAIHPGALLLSGGNDIGEFPDRDATEGYLLTWAKEKSAPVLGICRGMQMLGHWSGCGLKRTNGHVGTRHQLVGTLPGHVNSYHEFSLASCPSGFEVLATAEDGEIEAIRHIILPWEGWMWHPEREDSFSKKDLQRLVEVFS